MRGAWGGAFLYAGVSIARPVLGAMLRSRAARSIQMIQRRRNAIERWANWLIGAGAGLWWASRTLAGFELADPIRDGLAWLVSSPINIGSASFSLGDVLLFLATAAAGVLLSRVVAALLEEDVLPRARLARGVPHAITATIRYAILFAAFLLAAAAAGFEWDRVTLLAGAFGVGVGFGLQNIINNFMSGLILLYERPIQVGDTVEVKNLIGEVKRIGIRSSSVRTWQGAEVIVPNASLISEQVVNWTLSDRSRRIDLALTVADSVDPAWVLAQLEQIGRTHPDVMEEPEPTAVFQGFGPTGLTFELRVWTTQFERYARIRTELALAVHQALHHVALSMPAPPPDATLDSKEGA
jgi:potassium-dependent mechanosensitive channel